MNERRETVEEFLARGGQIIEVKPEEKAVAGNCQCGCRGNYTEHQMRKAENQDVQGYHHPYYG